MFKIVLINPPSNCVDDDHLEPQLGLLYIASLLRLNGFEVEIYEMTGCKTEDEIKEKINSIPSGDVYGFTVYCTNYPFVKRCIEHIKSVNERSPLIILGGPNPSALSEFTLKDSKCDCVITGEGEDAFLNVVNLYSQGSEFPRIANGTGRLDIDSYPMPAWDLIDLNVYSRVLDNQRVVSLISSRGCRYNCTHCNSIVMQGVRYRSTEKIIEEIEYLKSRGFTKFRFNDDNFTGNPQLQTLLLEIKKLSISYRIFARIEDLNESNCYMLAKSGCKHISVGIESLNPDNLKMLGKISQRGLEEKNLSNAKEQGITIRAFFIIGLPFDTDKTVIEYFEKASQLPFDEFSIYPLIPYPGTEIAKYPEKFGYQIIEPDFTKYVQIGKNKTTCFALRHKDFTENDVKRWYNYVEKVFISKDKLPQSQSQVAR